MTINYHYFSFLNDLSSCAWSLKSLLPHAVDDGLPDDPVELVHDLRQVLNLQQHIVLLSLKYKVYESRGGHSRFFSLFRPDSKYSQNGSAIAQTTKTWNSEKHSYAN